MVLTWWAYAASSANSTGYDDTSTVSFWVRTAQPESRKDATASVQPGSRANVTLVASSAADRPDCGAQISTSALCHHRRPEWTASTTRYRSPTTQGQAQRHGCGTPQANTCIPPSGSLCDSQRTVQSAALGRPCGRTGRVTAVPPTGSGLAAEAAPVRPALVGRVRADSSAGTWSGAESYRRGPAAR